ncbi:hypothetical protein N7474_003204 [Penicillium riverlandense]|uniref:uncharacterized protein n=1 Tax=Penicillium riverlandense TaxID=1903569 RepID=UPI002546F347|nr:uncharacterized protein N7474_003204 [Penicillium riverlandense]KAJ5826066.1 hypothetical protein N7474_003204 [Penicillium riverlandense]
MCLHTYHHYPVCGHISNWSVTSCLEFTNYVRQVAGTGQTVSCKQVEITHNLLPTTQPSLCVQCEMEWSGAVQQNDRYPLLPDTYRIIEGLDAKSPIIEFDARMTLDVRKTSSNRNYYVRPTDNDQCDLFADGPLHEAGLRSCRACRPPKGKERYSSSSRTVSRSTQTDVSGIEKSRKKTFADCLTQSPLNSRCDEARPSAGENPAKHRHSRRRDLRTDICESRKTADTAKDLIDFASITCKPSCGACWTSSDDMSKLGTLNKPATSLDSLETNGPYSVHSDLPCDELPIFMSTSPYDWISTLSLGYSFLEDATPVLAKQFEGHQDELDEKSTEQSDWSDRSSACHSPAPALKPVRGRKGTPYTRPLPHFQRFQSMPSDTKADGLGMFLPPEWESYFDCFFRDRFC